MNKKLDFPIFKQMLNGHPLCYLDSASTSQKPQYMLDRLMRFYSTEYANIYRGTHGFGERATTLYEEAREKVARFIGADNAREIIFTRGTTSAINAIATSWAREKLTFGDEIVLTELEHHSNLVPWQQVARHTGARLRFIPVKNGGLLDLTNLDSIINEKTKLVGMIQVSNAVGTRVDIGAIIAAAKKVSALTLVDAAQSVPSQVVNVKEIECDFLVFSGHKMLAPTGIGVLYIKHTIFDQVPPYQFGGGMVYQCSLQSSDFLPPPQKYEAGTPPIAQAIALGYAIDYLTSEVDFNAIHTHQANLCSYLIDELQKLGRVHILGPVEQLKKMGHLVSFIVDGYHAHDVAAYLDQQGICVRAGHHCAQNLAKSLGIDASVRASFYLYNDAQDVERLVRGIRELVDQ